MKTIGLIGGMSWESTVTYYQIVNETMKEELGGLHSAKVLLYSVDFAEIEECKRVPAYVAHGITLTTAIKAHQVSGIEKEPVNNEPDMPALF